MASTNPFDKYWDDTPTEDGLSPLPDAAAQPDQVAEQTAEPEANPFDKYWDDAPAPEAAAPPPEEMGTVGNLWAGLKERAVQLASNVPGGIQTYGDALEGEDSWVPSLGGVVHEGGLDFDYLSPEEWKKYGEDGGRMGLRELQEDWAQTSYGFTSNAGENWEILKGNAGLLEKIQAGAAFALETGVISLADMAGAVLVPPAYIISRAEEIAQERAIQAGRPGKPNNDDLKISLGAAILIQAMERFGFDKIAEAWTKGGPALKKILTAGVAEAGTEGVQEPLEFAAETYGTAAEEAMTPGEYAAAAGERSLQGMLGGGPAGAVLAAPGVLLSDDGPISDEVKSTEENKDAVTRELNKRGLQMEQDRVIRDEREMLESEVEAEQNALELAAAEVDAQEKPYKSRIHAELKAREIVKKHGSTSLQVAQNTAGEWVLTRRSMADLYRIQAEQPGIDLRPTETGQMEVEELLDVATEPNPTAEGIEVNEDVERVTLEQPEGVEVTETTPEEITMKGGTVETGLEPVTPPLGWDEKLKGEAEKEVRAETYPSSAHAQKVLEKLQDKYDSKFESYRTKDGWKIGPPGLAKMHRKKDEIAAKRDGLDEIPTRSSIEVEEVETIDATEPQPTAEGIEVTEGAEEIDVGAALPGIGVTEVTEGEETIEMKGNRIYQRPPKKPPPDDDEPPPGGAGAPVEPGGGPGPISPSVLSGAIKKGRKPRADAKKELSDVDAQISGMPTNIDAMSEDAPGQMDQARDLLTKRRDLQDEIEYGVTPEEAKQARSELLDKLHELGGMVPKYSTIAEIRREIGVKQTGKAREGVYQTVVDAIAKAADEGVTPTVEYLQTKLGLAATPAKKYLDRYNKEVMDAEPDTKPLVSPETPPEQTQDHPKVPGRMDSDTLPDGTEYDLSKSAETQIATTVGTYDKANERYFDEIDNGDILDYGAGKGLASQKHGFESLEPYPRGWTPTYQSTYKIKRQYAGIILNNILNVLPKHSRRAVLWDAAEKLRPGAQMYINVRSRGDVMKTAVIAKQFNDSEILTGRGTYQKGFQQAELANFIQDELGPDYTVETAEFGSVSVIVTKAGPKPAAEPGPVTNEEAAAAAAALTEEGREPTDTEAQIAAFNFIDSNPALMGLKLSHKPGDERYGKTLANYYGDIDGTEGADGDRPDVILSKNFEIGQEYPIYIANLIDPKTGDFEQHKILAGFEDILDAEDGVGDMYPDQNDDITLIDPEEFRIWLASNRPKEPFDRDRFRSEMNKGKDLASPVDRDEVLDPGELAATQADAIDHSPWLLADGSIVSTGGDHMAYAMERGMTADDGQDLRAISQMQVEGKGVRSAFFYDKNDDTNVAWLHLHDDQALTEEQISSVEEYVRASKKAGRKAKVLIGSTATYEEGSPEINPVTQKTSVAGLRRDWSERKRNYRADMAKFYAGLADKSAKYAMTAVRRLKAQLRPNPRTDDLITYLRKHGGLNVNLGGDWRGRLSHLNREYNPPGLPGIEQTDGTGLPMDEAALIALEGDFIVAHDADLLAKLLEKAEDGTKIYSNQNQEWMKAGWDAEQEAAYERYEAETEIEAIEMAETYQGEDLEMAELIAQATLLDEGKVEALLEKESIPDNEIKKQLRGLIDERKKRETAEQDSEAEADEDVQGDNRVEAEAPADADTKPVRESEPEPTEEPDAGDYGRVEDFPWQDLAVFHGVEILEPPSPDFEGPRTFVIDVYSDVQRTKFVKQVFAANYFRLRDVETAFLARQGPFKARLQERDEFIQISKMSYESDDGHHRLVQHIQSGKLKKPYRKLEPITRIEGERKDQRAKDLSRKDTGWLTEDQWKNTIVNYQLDLMAERDPRDIVKHWGEEFKRGDTPRNYISHKQGKAKIAEWKARAKEVRKLGEDQGAGGNSSRIILSLFDATGEWAQPWIDAGYDVRAIDLKRDDLDIMDIDYGWLLDMGFLEGPGIWGILAACPCQKFTNTNARDWTSDKARPVNEGGADNIGFTHASVDLVNHTLGLIDFLKPRFWALENPLGRIKDITGVPEPSLSFNPNNYGDPYTKKTQLFGNFNPNLPTANVDPRKEHGGEGSRSHNLGGKDELDGGLRSVTPEGFAYSFFVANNDFDNPVITQVVREEFVRNIDDSVKEKDPNIERKVELVATLAMANGSYPTRIDLEDGTVKHYSSGNYYLKETDSWPNWAKQLIEEVQEAIRDDWRISEGTTFTIRQLNEMDAELRTLLGVSQKNEVKYPQKDEIDAEPVQTLNDLGEPYIDEDFSSIDPYMMEAAVDAVNIAIEDLAAQGYTFADLRGVARGSLPKYLTGPLSTITDVASGAIPVAKALKLIQKGDKRSKPESALDRLHNWKKALDKATNQVTVPEKEFKNHVREEYPILAKALDKPTDDDPGVAMRRQPPGYTEAQRGMYESLGRDDMAWEPAEEGPAMPAEEGPPVPVPPKGEPSEEVQWEPVPDLQPPPLVDIGGVLDASAEATEGAATFQVISGDEVTIDGKTFTKDKYDAALVTIKADTLERLLTSEMVGPAPGYESQISNRIDQFKQFWDKNDSITTGSLAVNEKGYVSFTNGRHRTRVMLEKGMTEIPVSMSKEALVTLEKIAEPKALSNIPLTAVDGDRSVTHNAQWWKNAIDQRLKNLNKIRGCA